MSFYQGEKKVLFQDLGLIEYKKAWDYQEQKLQELVMEREELKKDGKSNGILQKQVFLFCEHPHVYTLGKSGRENNLLINSEYLNRINASFYRINRGGDITYHGPGQIVGYPIIDLDSFRIKIKEYIWKLEESVIRLLAEYNIKAVRMQGATGVWLNTQPDGKIRKICAIGVRVSNRVTMHGFAFNVNTDLKYFNYINPCGFTDREVTSLSRELGKTMDMEKIKSDLKYFLAEIFDIEWKMVL